MKKFLDLSEQEILALAIASEDEDARIYRTFAQKMVQDYPATAALFDAMAAEEIHHRDRLSEMFRKKFGENTPFITRQDVKGFIKRQPLWLFDHIRIEAVRRQVAEMEIESANFYTKAEEQAKDPDIKRLLHNLALAEKGHEEKAEAIERTKLTHDKKAKEDAFARRLLLLQIVQPGLSGLIDGSISTIAPIFAAAFATHSSTDAFLVGLAASLGSGISMGLTEGLSDDGTISGRGQPFMRGLICGLMTTLGGLGHTLPFLIPDFAVATGVAITFVGFELAAISWVRWKFMDTSFAAALVQVVLGGIAVFLTGMLIGSA